MLLKVSIVVLLGALLAGCAGADPRGSVGHRPIGGEVGGAGGVIFAPEPQNQPKR